MYNKKCHFQFLGNVHSFDHDRSVPQFRPLSPLSSDSSDLQALTPGHILIIGEPLTAPAEPDILDIKSTRLSKYQHLEQMRQHFWKLNTGLSSSRGLNGVRPAATRLN
jgi:hypothetical protein